MLAKMQECNIRPTKTVFQLAPELDLSNHILLFESVKVLNYEIRKLLWPKLVRNSTLGLTQDQGSFQAISNPIDEYDFVPVLENIQRSFNTECNVEWGMIVRSVLYSFECMSVSYQKGLF